MRPAPRLLAVVLGWAALGWASGLWPALEPAWAGLGLALLVACAFDGWRARGVPALRLVRRAAGVWPVEVWGQVELELFNEGGRALALEVFDDYPGDWRLDGLPRRLDLSAGEGASFSYRLQPVRRGDAHFGAAHLRVASPLGLWQRVHRVGQAQTVRVYPDFSKLLGHTLSAADRRVQTGGLIRRRRRGEGTEFRQLREYRDGDSQRAIDWKATARQRKLISREYQEERDQQVVFLLDTGRRMLARDEGVAHFDHALGAVLTLAFVAQKQGDAVGLMSFGGDVRWIAPAKGRAGLDRLLAGIYDLQASEVAPDYTAAASALRSRLGKRAFVVLITNLRDEDDLAMRNACRLLSARHLVMCASLREHALDEALLAPVRDFAGALRHCASADYLRTRRAAIERLGIAPGHLLDVTPQQLSAALTRRYLDIKESGQL